MCHNGMRSTHYINARNLKSKLIKVENGQIYKFATISYTLLPWRLRLFSCQLKTKIMDILSVNRNDSYVGRENTPEQDSLFHWCLAACSWVWRAKSMFGFGEKDLFCSFFVIKTTIGRWAVMLKLRFIQERSMSFLLSCSKFLSIRKTHLIALLKIPNHSLCATKLPEPNPLFKNRSVSKLHNPSPQRQR